MVRRLQRSNAATSATFRKRGNDSLDIDSSAQYELLFIRFNSAVRRRRYCIFPLNEKTTQATSGPLFTARRLVKLSGEQGFQAPVAYSVIKESQNPAQSSRAFVFSQAFSENLLCTPLSEHGKDGQTFLIGFKIQIHIWTTFSVMRSSIFLVRLPANSEGLIGEMPPQLLPTT